jgi:dihydroorotate dehydrogenase electron transfer subunit
VRGDPVGLTEPRTLAPFGRRTLEVAERRELGAYVVLTADDPAGPMPRAGQFYMLAAAQRWGGREDERPFLPRAFSVLRAGAGRLEFMLEAVGPGTARLAELAPGDGLHVTGPLGIGFPAPDSTPPTRRALLCGGGVGTAPLAIWQDELLARGEPAPALLGFRDAAHAPGAELLHNARVATDDGSRGHHGLVTDLLAAELDADDHVVVYACGPPAMLESVRALCEQRAVPSRLALESGMACGFGACFGCVVPLRAGGYLRLCVDGPVLDGELLAEVPAH